ncbi:MAG: NAD-dependent epimerase/dehydratase family protein [Thermaerobacter sp.]|nr:NAD-dependent epimerase/dehydratase family protein [Thermaerobacter sp.]
MKAVVFGASGFIGGHVAQQLRIAGHDVLAPVRAGSDRAFLDALGIRVTEVDFSNAIDIERVISGSDAVFNCTAKVGGAVAEAHAVDVVLTVRLMRATARVKTPRFLQLSTIVIYGFDIEANPADEFTPVRPMHGISRVALQREQAVHQIGRETGLEYVLLRPASTIGPRDQASFFSRMCQAHAANAFPMIGGGKSRFSAVDTRDIGRAMEWLAQFPQAAGETYLLRGFELTWAELKDLLDQHRGVIAKTVDIPRWLALSFATVQERIVRYPRLTRYAVDALSRNRVWDDRKIRSTGFNTAYGREESVRDAFADVARRAEGGRGGR